MTGQPVLIQPDRLHPATLRLRYFALLVVMSAIVGGIAGASRQLLGPALLLWIPAYVLWVWADLRVRGVVGWSFVFQVTLALVPLWGLLLYLLWSRRLIGLAEWMVFLLALWIPALLAAGFAHGVAQFARGERW